MISDTNILKQIRICSITIVEQVSNGSCHHYNHQQFTTRPHNFGNDMMTLKNDTQILFNKRNEVTEKVVKNDKNGKWWVGVFIRVNL